MLTIPVTSACAERSFSKLKIIKSYLKHSIGQDKLSALALLSIEQDISKTINYEEIMNAFAENKSRKKLF